MGWWPTNIHKNKHLKASSRKNNKLVRLEKQIEVLVGIEMKKSLKIVSVSILRVRMDIGKCKSGKKANKNFFFEKW